MLEAAEIPHTRVQRILPCVAERGVPKVVRETDRLGKRFVQPEGARDCTCDLCNFE